MRPAWMRGLCAALALTPAWLHAQQPVTPPDLPADAEAAAWLDRSPSVAQARAALAAAGHGAAALAVSPNEWVLKAASQRRSVRGLGDSQEWSASLERPIRIGGKAALDRQLGEAELDIARARVGEMRHEAARQLADLWLDWLGAARTAELLQQQLGIAEANLRSVETRKRAGDAAMLDLNIARTDLADVQRQASLAASNLAKALARLRVRFPEARLELRPLSEPVAPAQPQPYWRERILSEADPVKVAEGLLRKAELSAARAHADRMPDPTIGVYTASEAFRNERIVGLSLSLPIGSSYRAERMQQSLREVDAARAALQRERLDIEAEVASNFSDAVGSTERWRIAEQAAAAAADSARLMQRAYSLGEAELQALLLARRQSLDAARAAVEARVDALRANYRLLIDAHLIWDLAHD